MCRYAMATYKPHFACFKCRKTFKRRLLSDIKGGFNKNETDSIAKCPECGELMADMGLDFEAPKKNDIKAWGHITTLYQVGITFHSCGCTGPGYIPKDSEELIKYFDRIKQEYLKHQRFWARRKNGPNTESDIARDQHKNGNFLNNAPRESITGTRKKPQYNALIAQNYWNEKVKEIERKIQDVNNGAPT